MGPWFYRLDRSRFPAGGSGSCFAYRQSRRASKPGQRRASKPGKRRAQRAECQKAGLRPAFSRRTRRAAEFGKRAWAPGSTAWTGTAPCRGNRLLFRVPAKSARFKTRQAARTTRQMSESGPKARFLAACTPPLRSSEEGLGPLVLPFGQEPLPRRGNRLLFRVPAKSARFKTRQAARTTRRISGRGLARPPQGASGSRFFPHSALRSTSSPSGPCATCWKPAFSYRRTGPA